MDPSSISPPPAPSPAPATVPATSTVPFPAEPNDLPPAPISAAPANHPPYAEMIYTAIEALKEKNGSSKRAIGKYIEQVYKEQLPPTHPALLTHHLKRLKNTGLLQMVKKSYKLPRSAPVSVAAGASGSTSQSPRPRGRPRKAQSHPDPQAQNATPQPPDANNPQQQNAEPVWAALGLADEPIQAATPEGSKKRGRPKRILTPGVAQPGPSSATPARRGRPPGSTSQKRPGRPPKTHLATGVSGGSKRRPGRPPKNQSQATQIPFAPPAPTAAEAGAAELPAQPAGAIVPVTGTARPRGRPKRNAAFAVAAVIAGARGRARGRGRGGGGGGKGRGRVRGALPLLPRKITGRPVGRPKKGSTSAGTSQNAANEDLRNKLEHFQSKVKESLAVLKPHFNHESPVTAIAAIQELEVLGTMDLNAPLRDEMLPAIQPELPPQQSPVQQQQPPQQQQLSPEHVSQPLLSQPQIYQQQFPPFHLQQFHQQQLQYQQQQQLQPQPQQQQSQRQLFQHQPPSPHQQQFHP